VKIVFVDGMAAALDAVVPDGGRVGIFPAVGGG
jgi:molybdopterin converting factor small subunit